MSVLVIHVTQYKDNIWLHCNMWASLLMGELGIVCYNMLKSVKMTNAYIFIATCDNGHSGETPSLEIEKNL